MVLLATVAFASCKSSFDKKSIIQQIDSLNNSETQALYLIRLKEKDQWARRYSHLAEGKYGHDSDEYKRAFQLMLDTDIENTFKIERYLKKYGYPANSTHGKEACEAPWLILHHSGNDSAERRNFDFVYQAWRRHDIDGMALTFFLNDMYRTKFGKRIEWNRPYEEKEEIDTLINSLGLASMVKQVDVR